MLYNRQFPSYSPFSAFADYCPMSDGMITLFQHGDYSSFVCEWDHGMSLLLCGGGVDILELPCIWNRDSRPRSLVIQYSVELECVCGFWRSCLILWFCQFSSDKFFKQQINCCLKIVNC